MYRHAYATAHCNTVNQGDIRFWKCFDEMVERIFLTIKTGCLGVTGAPPIMQSADVTSRAKPLFTSPFNDDMLDRWVARLRADDLESAFVATTGHFDRGVTSSVGLGPHFLRIP